MMKKNRNYHDRKHTARVKRHEAKRASKRRQAAVGRRTATKLERRANAYSKPTFAAPVFQSNWRERLVRWYERLDEMIREADAELEQHEQEGAYWEERARLLMTDEIEEGDKAA